MKIRLLLFSFLLHFVLYSFGQDSTNYYQLNKDIFSGIESSKIKYIQKLIDSVGVATPISNEILVKHKAFAASYNTTHRVPNYVVHVVPKDILYGTASRSNDFRKDPLIKENSADSADYWNSGYDRGHLAPSADFKWSKNALSESYYYSNIVPQNKELNQGAWNKLEMKIREWAIENNELIVVTGPILADSLPKIQQGSFQVSIPAYLYKIVLDYYPPTYKAIAFIYPNKNVPFDIKNHVVSIDSIEQLTGIDFFPNIADSIENEIEAEQDLLLFEKEIINQKIDEPLIKYGKGKISAIQAKDFIGKNTCVCGQVVSAKYNENGKANITYINLDKKYPDQVFTVVIFGKDRSNFSYKPEEFLHKKTICVKGKIDTYKNSPQIIVAKEAQIEIIKN